MCARKGLAASLQRQKILVLNTFFFLQTAIGDTLVQDVRYSPDLQDLLVRLSDSYDR